MQTPFLSKEVKLKRVCKVLGISLLVVIPLTVIISNFVTFLSPKPETNILGTEDINTPDYVYTKGADLYVKGEWKPGGYIPLERSVDNPEYTVEAGTILKQSYDIGNGNILNLECEKIGQEYLDIPPYWPKCSLKINDILLTNNLRSDIICEEYGYTGGTHSTNCKEIVGIVTYKIPSSSNTYLFLSSGESAGSSYFVIPYLMTEDSYTKLYFDFKDSIAEDIYVRGGLDEVNLYMAYTNSLKTELKLITREYDPSMQNISAVYYEWELTNNRLLLEKKVVSQ